MIALPPRYTLFPYTTLFRSGGLARCRHGAGEADGRNDDGTGPDDRRGRVPEGGNRFWTGSVQKRAHVRSEEHTSELQSRRDLVCRPLLEKKKYHEFSSLFSA